MINKKWFPWLDNSDDNKPRATDKELKLVYLRALVDAVGESEAKRRVAKILREKGVI